MNQSQPNGKWRSAPPLAMSAEVDALIKRNHAVAIGVSGGKDSQAVALAVSAHLDAVGHTGPRLLVHADLGSVEWDASLPACRALATHLGIELAVVGGEPDKGLMQMWENRWASSKRRYAELSTVTVVPPWSTPQMRFCTSDAKTHKIHALLSKRFSKADVVNVTGIRRDESSKRALSKVSDRTKDQPIVNWRPILDWSVEDVFGRIAASGMRPHEAYGLYGMSRVSCRFCIMSSKSDISCATKVPESHDIYREMVTLEADSAFSFQGDAWLADAAPHLLGDELAKRIVDAKVLSAARRAAEAVIPKGMLFEKGWPTRMLDRDEAELLAAVRQKVSALYGFTDMTCLTADGVLDRYASLMAEKASKDQQKRAKDERRAQRLAKAEALRANRLALAA